MRLRASTGCSGPSSRATVRAPRLCPSSSSPRRSARRLPRRPSPAEPSGNALMDAFHFPALPLRRGTRTPAVRTRSSPADQSPRPVDTPAETVHQSSSTLNSPSAPPHSTAIAAGQSRHGKRRVEARERRPRAFRRRIRRDAVVVVVVAIVPRAFALERRRRFEIESNGREKLVSERGAHGRHRGYSAGNGGHPPRAAAAADAPRRHRAYRRGFEPRAARRRDTRQSPPWHAAPVPARRRVVHPEAVEMSPRDILAQQERAVLAQFATRRTAHAVVEGGAVRWHGGCAERRVSRRRGGGRHRRIDGRRPPPRSPRRSPKERPRGRRRRSVRVRVGVRVRVRLPASAFASFASASASFPPSFRGFEDGFEPARRVCLDGFPRRLGIRARRRESLRRVRARGVVPRQHRVERRRSERRFSAASRSRAMTIPARLSTVRRRPRAHRRERERGRLRPHGSAIAPRAGGGFRPRDAGSAAARRGPAGSGRRPAPVARRTYPPRSPRTRPSTSRETIPRRTRRTPRVEPPRRRRRRNPPGRTTRRTPRPASREKRLVTAATRHKSAHADAAATPSGTVEDAAFEGCGVRSSARHSADAIAASATRAPASVPSAAASAAATTSSSRTTPAPRGVQRFDADGVEMGRRLRVRQHRERRRGVLHGDGRDGGSGSGSRSRTRRRRLGEYASRLSRVTARALQTPRRDALRLRRRLRAETG